jgi:hypothetical protein
MGSLVGFEGVEGVKNVRWGGEEASHKMKKAASLAFSWHPSRARNNRRWRYESRRVDVMLHLISPTRREAASPPSP